MTRQQEAVGHPAVSGAEAGSGAGAASADPISATRDHTAGRQPGSQSHGGPAEPAYDAFWFAVGQTRQIVDEHTGQPVFVIEPGGWVLALQDRGNEFLVQNTDGRVGVLRDLTNIERA